MLLELDWSDVTAEEVREAIDNGADVNAKDRHGKTPLMKACEGSYDVAIVKLLIESGADVKIEYNVDFATIKISELSTCMRQARMTALHFACLNRTEAVYDIVEYLFSIGVNIHETDNLGRTALMHACCNPHPKRIDVVKLLTNNGADVNIGCNARDKIGLATIKLSESLPYMRVTGMTALHFACRTHDYGCQTTVNVVKYLIDKGADVNAVSDDGKTPLMWACENTKGDIDMIKLLLDKGADVNAVNNKGKTPLMWVCESTIDDIDKIKLLLEKGADINAVSNDGKTVLMYVCESIRGDIDKIKLLLEKGADINAVSNDGKTALMYVCDSDSGDDGINKVKLLVEKGADVNAVCHNKKRALYYIKKRRFKNDDEIIEFLKSKGAKLTGKSKS